MRKILLVGLTFLVASGITLYAPDAEANNWSHTWPNKEYKFKVNLTPFTNLKDLNLTESEARFWITYATKLWAERTDVDFEFTYSGDTSEKTNTCLGEGSNGSGDGTNEILALPESYKSSAGISPDALATACADSNDSNKTIDEVDIVVWEDSTQWNARSSNMPSSSKYDLISVLVHEIGHAIGSLGETAHESKTVMNSSATKSTRGRYPFGHDIEGLRALYGFQNTRTRYWREWDWSSDSWKSSSTNFWKQ